MAVLPTIEHGWLRHARRVVTDLDHRERCRSLGGSPAGPGVDDPDLRWPGYLGERYRAGGVLCVANVHRDFASAGMPTALAELLVNTTRAWRENATTDTEYLVAVRTAYLQGLRTWTVGSRLGSALRVLGDGLDAIAYVNAARCQVPEVGAKNRQGRLKQDLQRLCLARFPLSDLVDILRPRVVLSSSVTAYDATGGRCGGAPMVCFHQHYGNLTRPLTLVAQDGQPVELPARTPLRDWSAAVARLGHE